jgi:basic amino acid/polyamine antiporter, APA family
MSIPPKNTLSVLDVVAFIIGIVVGVGLFKAPAVVASSVRNELEFFGVWVLGGFISLLGALCYAELGSAYPHPGGEYHYLRCAFGSVIGWLFAWSRLTVLQTGSIAILAFVFGDYLSQLHPLGAYSSSLYASIAIGLMTLLNILGLETGKWTQRLLTAAKVLGILLVCGGGLGWTTGAAPQAIVETHTPSHYGQAMIFVLLTYGGWSESAYLAAELEDAQRNLSQVLVGAICLITSLFVGMNYAYIQGLGLAAIAQSEVVAADLLNRAVGEVGKDVISLLIAISTLGAMNGTIWTGARLNAAVGQDVPLLGVLGQWHSQRQTPINALLVQGGITLALVLLGTLTRSGFTTIVNYTAPVFWFFLLLVTMSLFVLRHQAAEQLTSFRVPFYPFTPIVFGLACVFMVIASLRHAGVGGIASVILLLTGIPIYWLARAKSHAAEVTTP